MHICKHPFVTALGLLTLLFAPALQAAEAPWTELGRQGITRIVIVPLPLAADREAYVREIARMCPTGPAAESCFINFYTNSRGVELALPLPDAVAQEPTAMFRRSAKQGAELFRFSCRLALDPVSCF